MELNLSIFRLLNFPSFAGAEAFKCRNWDSRSCDFNEWWNVKWWESAVETFDFASNNWEEFIDAVKSVGRVD